MTMQLSFMPTDQELLRNYVTGVHGAFRELVDRHAGAIYGAALRITTDCSVAEEVVQDTFCLLARKAAILSEHPCLVGWLHRTALNTARSHRRAKHYHDRKIARFASEALTDDPAEENPDTFFGVDAAIDRLPTDERAVVVLRFFQDRDYPEISRQLGISEAAARKRLSRGLQRLHRFLTPAAVASLTPACLAATAPAALVESVIAAAPATVPAAGWLFSFFVMNTKTTLAIAAATLLTGSLTWWGTQLSAENKRLASELATLRSSLTKVPDQKTPGSTAAEDAKVAGLQKALETETQKRQAAEQEVQSVRTQLAGLKDEVVVSYGKVEQIGSTFGSVVSEAQALWELERKGQINTVENQERFAKFVEQAASITGLSKEIISFEDVPAEGSQFVASAYASVFALTPEVKEKVAAYFSERLAAAGAEKLTLANLPARGSPEMEPWLTKRWAFFDNSRAELRDLLPADKRALFDQSVEKGGYGFKGMKLKGMPLMFSLGGDPR